MTNKNLQLSSVPYKNQDAFISSVFGEELMLMNMESGDYIHINEIGKAIWNKLDSLYRISDLCAELLTEFDIDEETCRIDTLEFLDNLYQQKIILAK